MRVSHLLQAAWSVLALAAIGAVASWVPARAQDSGSGSAARFVQVRGRELVSPEGVLVPLSGGEFALLAAFVTHPQRVLSRDQLLDLARGRDAQPFDRAIDVQVSRLRRKLEADPREPTLIKTVRGGGYFFSPPVERD